MAESIAYALTTYLGASASAATAWSYVIVAAATVAYGGYQQRKAEARARDAANASAKDREVMIRSAIAPRRYIYGTDRVSGPIVFMQSTGDKSQYLHLVIALAAHECDAVEKIWFNDVELPALDGSGFVTDGEFKSAESSAYDTYSGTTDGSGNITLPQAALSIEAAYTEVGYGEAATQTHYPDRTHTAGSATVGNLPAATAVTLSYAYAQAGSARVRVHVHLGGSGQTADADLISECGGTWTSAHIGADICYLAVRLEYDQDIFGSIGIPNISALVRGKKVYDPRTSTTAWSSNAALCVADFLKSTEGMRATGTEVPDAEIITAANICDEVIDLELGGATTQLRYTCDTSFTSERAPRDVLGELATCMAGRCVWAQGRWLVRAGAHRTPTLTITADMLAGSVSVAPRTSRSDLFNAVRATYRDPDQQYAEVQAPLVLNSGYEAEDGGVRIVRQIDIPTLADTYRAQRLAKIELERARQALSVRLTTTLRGYDLSPTDTVMLTLDLYGFDAKVFEVLERTLNPAGQVEYTLRETAAGVWDWNYGEATVGDLAPNTTLPSPFAAPAALTGLTASQSQTLLGDGTIVAQATLTWNPSQDAFVIGGGRIDVQWSRAEPIAIISTSQAGTTIGAVLAPLVSGIAYIARVRQVNAVGRLGPWSYASFVAGADTVPPEDVQNLDWEIKPGLVKITCDPCIAADYAATELRVLATVPDYDSGDWGAAIFLVRGASNEYHHPRPPNGTYYVLAKHMDTSGNYSVNPAYITVVVDDSIDFGLGGTLRLSTSRFPVFMFATGTTHTALAPGDTDITITARLIGLVGVANFVAEAFDSSDASLGTFALGGTGNARTISAAQFVSLGTSGSVRTVVVAATLGSASDYLTIYRQDSTTTAPRLYLSNPFEAVATDEAGDFGDYSNAVTDAVVYAGVTDVTGDFTFSMTPDAGVTAAINGGAGPVTAASVVVAVYDMTNDDGAVFLSADDGVVTAPLTASFFVSKRKAPLGSAYAFYFSPRSEIRLPVDSSGAVSSYEAAWTDVKITKGGSLDDTAQWTLSKVDNGVVSTLISGRIQITSFVGLGAVTGTDTYSVPYATAGWDRPFVWIYDDLHAAYITLGHINSGTWSNVMVGPDPATFNIIGVGLAGRWNLGAYDQGAICLVESGVGSTDKVRRSTDGGQTWATGTALSSLSQWVYAGAANGRMYVSSYYSLACRSTNGGSTWSTITTPAGNLRIYGGLGRLIGAGSDDVNRQSFDHGDTWSTPTGIPFVVNHADPFRGRLWATGRYSSTNKIVYAEASGGWVTVTLPGTYTNGILVVVSDVLYLVGGTNIMYCADGATWALGSLGGAAYPPVVANGASIPSTYIPLQDYNGYAFAAHLSATSADTGFVRVTASKAGELDFVRSLPVLKGTPNSDIYFSYGVPSSLTLPATSDGVVTSYAGATIAGYILKNGIDDTANWSWVYTTVHLTPASGSSNSVTITDMDDAYNTGSVSFVASKAGLHDLSGTINVAKNLGGTSSGPRDNAVFNAITFVETWLGIKFKSDGTFQLKVGSGGTYTLAGQWAGVIRSSNSSYWIRVEQSSTTGNTLSSGTTGSWLAMTSDREFTLSDASSGTHTVNLSIYFATDNMGSNATAAYGALQLVVP